MNWPIELNIYTKFPAGRKLMFDVTFLAGSLDELACSSAHSPPPPPTSESYKNVWVHLLEYRVFFKGKELNIFTKRMDVCASPP